MTAVRGEPFYLFPGPAISVGDPDAADGTDASRGVFVTDPLGAPSPNIIDTVDPFNITVDIRTAVPIFGGFPIPGGLNFNCHAIPLLGGTPINLAPPPLTSIPARGGDTGPRDQPVNNDVVLWFSSTIPVAANTLPPGTYRILVHGHHSGAGLYFFHEGTYIHVGP